MYNFSYGQNKWLLCCTSKNNLHKCLLVIRKEICTYSVNYDATCVMKYDGSEEHGVIILAMVIIVMRPNHTSHVWHRLYANLEMNSYN